MTTTYTKILKPSGTAYSKISGGYILYDDAMVTYDQSNITYDGLNHMSAYTKVSKAVGTSYTNIPKAI